MTWGGPWRQEIGAAAAFRVCRACVQLYALQHPRFELLLILLAGLVAVTANQTPLNYSLIVTNCMKLVAWAADNGDVNAWLLDVANDID